MNILKIILFILLLLLVSLILKKIYRKINKFIKKTYDLDNDGATLIPNILSENDMNIIKNLIDNKNSKEVKNFLLNSKSIKDKIKNILGEDYVFQDYMFILNKSKFNTCHRDYNGSFFNKDQNYTSYTILFFLENMDKCVDIIPQSHLSSDSFNINLTDLTESVRCNKGDAILFDANLIHSGSLNKRENNLRIQMKISHKDDIKALQYFENYSKALNNENKFPKWFQNFQKTFSCTFPIISNWLRSYDDNIKRDHTVNNETNLFSKYFYAKLDNL